MPDFVYDDDEPRTYLAFGDVQRGDVVKADEAPDRRFSLVVDKQPPKTKAAPVVLDTTPTEA